MTTETATMWCNPCQANTGHLREKPSHLLHFLLTLVTGGLWVVVWVALTLTWKNRHWLCMGCGMPYTEPRRTRSAGAERA